MQFANQAISLFISGVFCLVWMGILAFLFGESYVLEFAESIKNAADSSFYVVIFTFLVFPLAYAIGNGVNAVANKTFNRKDKKIRHKAFKKNLSLEKRDAIYDEICGYFNDCSTENRTDDSSKKNCWRRLCNYFSNYFDGCSTKKSSKNSPKIRRLYHHFRYILCHSGSDIYGYLIFHREIIRILRATCLNFALIFLSLSAILAKFVAKYAIYYSSFVHHPSIYFLIAFSFVISGLCFYAWTKQQKDFYVTIISGWVALDIKNKATEQKLQTS